MTFTIQNLLNSLAGVLKKKYPDYPVYISANQQGTDASCFFIFLMPSTITDEVDGMYARDLGVDLIFVQQRNAINGNAEIQEIQEYLDETLALFDYSDGTETIPLHTYEREASVEDQELHYKFHIRQRVTLPRDFNPMKILEESNVRVKED